MDVHRHRTSVEMQGDRAEARAVEVTMRQTGRGFAWSVANSGPEPAALRSVTAVCTLTGLSGRLRMFRNGWQSWSDTSVATLGVDVDPATVQGALELLVMTHHPDSRPPGRDRLRSEMVTVVADDRGAVLAGFLGGDRHDGTIWLAPGPTGQELRVQAFLGGAVLAPGEQRELHEVWLGPVDDPVTALEEWADEHGRRSGARVDAPYTVGWCSWYHYFQDVREADVRSNLAAAGDWPFDVFQVDDGFQSAVGDWLVPADTFPSGLPALASSVADAGMRPGIWLAPFLVAPSSVLAAQHPDWVARHLSGDPLIAMWNDHWGGFVHTLDTSHPAVLDHLEGVARALVEMGFTYLKVDFTFAPGMEGAYHDPSMTPAQRVRAGYDALRRGAGEDAFLLGCGAPLGATVGVVDGMRIGPDVAPWWSPRPDLWNVPGYDGVIPATVNAWRNTLARAFMHRRLWVNDPDCLMLRTTETDLTAEQVQAWASAVGLSGGMAVVSDDLGLLDAGSRALLDDVLLLGRAADRAALDGAGPRCADLMTPGPPTTLEVGGARLVGDPATGRAELTGA